MDVVICETCNKVISALDRYCAYCGTWQLGQVEAALSQEYSRRLRAEKLVSEDPSVSCRSYALAEGVGILFGAAQAVALDFPPAHVAHLAGVMVEGMVLDRLQK